MITFETAPEIIKLKGISLEIPFIKKSDMSASQRYYLRFALQMFLSQVKEVVNISFNECEDEEEFALLIFYDELLDAQALVIYETLIERLHGVAGDFIGPSPFKFEGEEENDAK